MDYSKFVIAVIIAYVAWIMLNILYDVFFKKSFQKKIESEDVILVDDSDYSDEINANEILKGYIDNDKSKDIMNKPVFENESEDIVEMEVENQGIPFELLMKKGNDLFADIQF